jgi:hypothetical protein
MSSINKLSTNMCGCFPLRESPDSFCWSSDSAEEKLLLDDFNQARLLCWPKQWRNFHSPEGAVLPSAQDALSRFLPTSEAWLIPRLSSRLSHYIFWALLPSLAVFSCSVCCLCQFACSIFPLTSDIINETKHLSLWCVTLISTCVLLEGFTCIVHLLV